MPCSANFTMREISALEAGFSTASPLFSSPAAAFHRTADGLRPLRTHQMRSRHIQIRQRTCHEGARAVLVLPAVPHLRKLEHALDAAAHTPRAIRGPPRAACAGTGPSAASRRSADSRRRAARRPDPRRRVAIWCAVGHRPTRRHPSLPPVLVELTHYAKDRS